MEELVDILIVTYNTNEKFLRKQIDSILRQTYKNLKIYISDNRSIDKNVEKVLKEYEEKDERIKLFIQPLNYEYKKNVEFLLKKSKAKYIMFAEDDDIWYKNKVEKCLKKLKEDEVDLVYCNCRQIDEEGIVLQDDYFKYKNIALINKNNKLVISRGISKGCSLMITRQVRNKMLPFKKYVIAHDWLAACIANEGNGISYIKEPLFDYRLNIVDRWKKEECIEVKEGRRRRRRRVKKIDEYEVYLKQRKEIIEKQYLKAIAMCRQYCKKEENKTYIANAKIYYGNILETKKVNWNIKEYFNILYIKNNLKITIKEIILFHFPIIGYAQFCIANSRKSNN